MIIEESLIETPSVFSQDWWQSTFLSKTRNLEETHVFKNCMSPTDVDSLRAEVFNTINAICKLRSDEHGFRVWEDGRPSTPETRNYFYDHPIRSNETLEDWTKRVFEDRKFGIILNAAEVLNPNMTKEIVKKMLPYFKGVGTPLRGYNITLFIGNYGYTPIGIHKDPPGESVIHFHLGPGKKVIYQWDNDELDAELRKHDLKLRGDVERLLPLAKPYRFSEGDLYFMPSKNYHIGETDELSIGIAVWSNKNFKDELAKELLRTVQEKYLNESEDDNLTKFNGLQAIENSYDLFHLPEDHKSLTFKELCLREYKLHRYGLLSNLGFLKPPLARMDDLIASDYSGSFVLETPFRIEYYVSELNPKILEVYVRGHRIILENHIGYEKIFQIINNGEAVTIQSMLDFADDILTKDRIVSLFNDLYRYHGIQRR